MIPFLIINIALSWSVIGLKDHVFSTNCLPIMESEFVIGRFVIGQSVIGQLDEPITIKTAF